MNKKELMELRRYVGDTDTVVGIRDYTFNEGKEKGVRVLQVKNGAGLELSVLPDRAMDIAYLTYRGMNIGFNSKTGITSPYLFTEKEQRGFLKTFYAGFLTTCGITYSGAPSVFDGRECGLHGVISNTPADMVCKEVIGDDEVRLRVAGRLKEACLYEEHMVLDREIIVDTSQNTFEINDRVTNMGFSAQAVMNLYHINFGYPMLDEGARLYFSAANITPRDDGHSAGGLDTYNRMEKPQESWNEQCFAFTDDEPQADSFAMIVSKDGGLAVVIRYDGRQCPIFNEWKHMKPGDYVLGMEPTVSGIAGKAEADKQGLLKYLQPGEECDINIRIEILEDAGKIQAYISRAKR